MGSEGSAVRVLDDEHRNLTIVDELNHLMTEGEKVDLDENPSEPPKLPLLKNERKQVSPRMADLRLRNEGTNLISQKKFNVEDYIHKNMVNKTRADAQIYQTIRNKRKNSKNERENNRSVSLEKS